MSNITHIRNKRESDSFIEGEEKCIIFYSAKYCPACHEIKPLYARIAKRYSEKYGISFSIMDIEEAGLQLDTVPIFEGYHRGEGVKRMEGVDTASLKQFIKAMIKQR